MISKQNYWLFIDVSLLHMDIYGCMQSSGCVACPRAYEIYSGVFLESLIFSHMPVGYPSALLALGTAGVGRLATKKNGTVFKGQHSGGSTCLKALMSTETLMSYTWELGILCMRLNNVNTYQHAN